MKKHPNYSLLFLIIFIISFSFLFLACLSASLSMQNRGNIYYFLLHQVLFGLLPGVALGLVAYMISLNFLKKWAPALVFVNILALFAVFIPGIGIRAGGATRWLNLGFTSIQPAEFLKITAIIYLSAWIASKLSDSDEKSWKSAGKKSYHNVIYILAPFMVLLGLILIGLILQRDLSTLGIIGATLLALYFSAKTPFWHTITLVALGATAFLIFIRFEQYRVDRFFTFLNPDHDPMGKGLQLKQSMLALGSGGFFGKGLGMSAQKFFLPESMTDSIFAIIGEELGIIGCLIIVISFILLFWMGIKMAKDSKDRFSQILAIGIVFYLTFQALINMSSVVGIFPLAGIPLPLFSYGGSHLVVELIALGLLLNISKNT
ncbi:MAG: putative peptidoglycan glycosyltransferase FtsW [Candidatus Staskawiczbacteria bacterium]|jgi:cell division protein FtsW